MKQKNINYWKEHYDGLAIENSASLLRQIGKTINGIEVNNKQIDLIVSQVSKMLNLNCRNKLVDFGCGNGVLTEKLAVEVGCVIGIDFSKRLIEHAESNNVCKNIEYISADILELDEKILGNADRFVMYEVLQHLSDVQFSSLLKMIDFAPLGTLFYIGGIPDKKHLRDFYDTETKYQFFLSRDKENRPHMGKWWLDKEIKNITESLGWKFKRLEQDQDLYTAYYRFDVLLEKL